MRKGLPIEQCRKMLRSYGGCAHLRVADIAPIRRIAPGYRWVMSTIASAAGDLPSIGGHSMPLFRRWLAASDAVVITAICSGMAPPPPTRFETPGAAISRLVLGAGRFQLMQLGICLLRRDVVDGQFRARPITIDVFPAAFPLSDRLLLTKTLFDSDAVHMKLLSDANFDFNRVLLSGMNWLSSQDEV